MSKRILLASLFIGSIFILTGCVRTLQTNIKENLVNNESNTNYQTPILTCVQGKDGEDCSKFEQQCNSLDGITTWTDGHPGPYQAFLNCYKKSPDIGKACGSNSDCLSGICNLNNAKSKCSLVSNKEFLKYPDSTPNDTVYECSNIQPGVCDSPKDIVNPGGKMVCGYRMEDKYLIEICGPGPIF